MTLVFAMFFGLTPALQAARQGHRAHRTRRVLIAVQAAASCILLILSGLLARGLHVALSTDPGFEYKRVLTVDPSLYNHGYEPALAAVGLYGLVSYAVVQRQKEIGLRIALGARTTNVISLVLRQLYGPVGAGICAGIAAAAGLSQLLRRELFGLSHLDPISYAGAIGFFLLVAGLAAFIPARRALRVNPVEVLRYD